MNDSTNGSPAASVSGEPVVTTLKDGTRLCGLTYRADVAATTRSLCVCIHGLGVDLNVWQFVAPQLCALGLDVLCLDLPGHGLSEGRHWRSMHARTMGQDLLAALGNLGLEPELLLAQSFGTRVALELLRCYPREMKRPTLYAVTPVWTGSRKSLRSLPQETRRIAGFLRAVGRHNYLGSERRWQRRDHTQYADHPDWYLPRFCEETDSISWRLYARLLAGMTARDYFAPENWEAIADWPVCMVGCTDDGLWNSYELETVQRRTGWPLYWLEMRHISIATQLKHAETLVGLLEKLPMWPKGTSKSPP